MAAEDPHDLNRFVRAQEKDTSVPSPRSARDASARIGRIRGGESPTVDHHWSRPPHPFRHECSSGAFGMARGSAGGTCGRHSTVYRRRPRQMPLPFPLQITRPLAS